MAKSHITCSFDCRRVSLQTVSSMRKKSASVYQRMISVTNWRTGRLVGCASSALGGGSIPVAHDALGRLAGGGAALAFAVALLASGLSSSSVGTYAGQVVMQGFLGRRIPLFLRRALTMLPALVVLAAGLPPTTSLVISQVVLSFGIPFALVPLVLLTRRADIMGPLVNRRPTSAVAAAVTAVIVLLNGYLLYVTLAS